MDESIIRNVFVSLVKDFRLQHGNGFAEKALTAFLAGPQDFRAYVFPTLGEVPVQRLKAYRQLQHLYKRHTFATDALTDDSVTESTVRKYLDFQEARSVYRPFRTTTFSVLQEARRICREILSLPYTTHQYRRNGRRAALGVPLKNAYFDSKWGDPKSFSCPSALRKDFYEESVSDPLLKPIVRRLFKSSKRNGVPLNLCADTLDLTLVPKSWDKHRCITPLSVFGLYWSFGIGGYVEDCLRMSNLDIKRLQERHKHLARRYSVNRTHVTADLSSASDSLRADILNRILPRHIYRDLRKTFVKNIRIGDDTFHTVSSLPMGNGATFPVETLIFYCLIKAVGNLLNVKGTYSVYGDDLIYPRRIHTYVTSVLSDLGIGVNGDKTFVESHFRESCGGDYYHGVDVRPAMLPSGRAPEKGRLKIVMYLYKVLNSLLFRWDRHEIPQTVRYLISEIFYLHGRVFQVPLTFPSSSGIQTECPLNGDGAIPFMYPKRIFKDGSSWFHFKFIGQAKPESRRVVHEDIYYWDNMNSNELTCCSPPIPWVYGIRKYAWSTRELSNWFLKSIRLLDGKVREKGERFLSETLHSEGLTKVNVSIQSSWT